MTINREQNIVDPCKCIISDAPIFDLVECWNRRCFSFASCNFCCFFSLAVMVCLSRTGHVGDLPADQILSQKKRWRSMGFSRNARYFWWISISFCMFTEGTETCSPWVAIPCYGRFFFPSSSTDCGHILS